MTERIYGTHHIGITVPDIEQGIAFFEAVFGAVTVFRTGPFNVDEAFMQRKLGAAPHTRIRDLVFLRCGDGPSSNSSSIAVRTAPRVPNAFPKSAASIFASRSTTFLRPPSGCGPRGSNCSRVPTLSKRGRSPASAGSISTRPGARHWKSRAFPRSATKRTRRNGCGGRRHNGGYGRPPEALRGFRSALAALSRARRLRRPSAVRCPRTFPCVVRS
jgi:catechol 2,3-dioxygenase-like lactoylglutathione lyase family enzyme